MLFALPLLYPRALPIVHIPTYHVPFVYVLFMFHCLERQWLPLDTFYIYQCPHPNLINWEPNSSCAATETAKHGLTDITPCPWDSSGRKRRLGRLIQSRNTTRCPLRPLQSSQRPWRVKERGTSMFPLASKVNFTCRQFAPYCMFWFTPTNTIC